MMWPYNELVAHTATVRGDADVMIATDGPDEQVTIVPD
jgi:hypothetical protein